MPDKPLDPKPTNGKPAEFVSRLEHGKQRFLAHVIVHALEVGRRTPDDFLRHFPPQTIMNGLAHRSDLRAAILTPTTGLKRRIAVKKTWQSAAEDVATALGERETTSADVVAAFPADDQVRYLDQKALWSFIIEGEFWNTPKDGKGFDTAKRHIAFMLTRALVDALITPADVIEGISIPEIATHVPRGELATVLLSAIEIGKSGKPYTEAALLASLPPETLVDHVPLKIMYEAVIHAGIAEPQGYIVETPAATPPPAEVAVALPGVLIEAKTETKTEEAKPTEIKVEEKVDAPVDSKSPKRVRKSSRPPGPDGTVEDAEDDWIEIPESSKSA